MYIQNGIVYAGEQKPEIKISGIRVLDGYKLWLRFNTGETGIVDFFDLLEEPVFKPLADEDTFKGVYIDYGVPVWMDGEIDIDPTFLYNRSALSATA